MKPAKVRRTLELQTKEVDFNEAGEWLETVVQVQEIALGRASTKENPEQEKSKVKLYLKKVVSEQEGCAELNSCKFTS